MWISASSLSMWNSANGTDANVTEALSAGPLVSLPVPVLMFCTGLLGNLLALLLLWRSRRENARSVFYRLVAGLALTDLLGTIATSPVTILVYSKERQWLGGQPVCDYFSFMMIFAGLATVLVVGCMALERYLAILYPYLYQRHVAPERVKWLLAGVWLVATFISSLPLLQVGSNVLHYPGTWCFFDFHSHRQADVIFSLFYASIGLLVVAATAVCNVAVMCVLLSMRRVSQNVGRSSEGRTLNMTSEMQMIFFLAGIILVFAACYSPLMVRVIMNSTVRSAVNVEADLLAIRLASVNQILDPWVYLLFRRRLAALLYSACKTVSPLQTLSFLKAQRAEFGHNNSFKASPAPAPHANNKTDFGDEERCQNGNRRLSGDLGFDEKHTWIISEKNLLVKSDENGHCSLHVVPVECQDNLIPRQEESSKRKSGDETRTDLCKYENGKSNSLKVR